MMRKIPILLLTLLAAAAVAAETQPSTRPATTRAVHVTLEPEHLLLVVNKNMPAGGALAEYYRLARLVPQGRIVALDLPVREEMSFADCEQRIYAPLRRFLRENHLERSVRCIVTFHGVPLRIAPRVLTAEEKEEAKALRDESGRLIERIGTLVAQLEKEAQQAQPSTKPASATQLAELSHRADLAIRELMVQAERTADPKVRAARSSAVLAAIRELGGAAAVLRKVAPAPEAREKLLETAHEVGRIGQEISRLADERYDAAARAQIRKLVPGAFGLLEAARTAQAQADYLTGAEKTGAAVDSELSWLWMSFYGREDWVPNPLHYRSASRLSVPALMVSRLDAPQAGQVREMILACLKAEREGLKGKIVLDGRGMVVARGHTPPMGSYPWYDQSIRNLSSIVRQHTHMQMLYDDSPDVLPPNSAQDVALYCGWYSVRNYVPSCRFNLGAVGFHVASFELVSLRNEQEKGWCRGLINDGVAATLGPVGEPYLIAFPPADEFFPLLLTGRYTLAECYWLTQPTASWMVSLIGDPLYTPYKAKPALKTEDLPAALREAGID